jgi:XTP/dITP diphosphohydrolase
VKTYVATKNDGKLRELRELFANSKLELETFVAYAAVEEVASSYVGNAMLKARALQQQLRSGGVEAAVLADDSGLEVDALGGRPGVLSARYAGLHSSWTQRREAMLEELKGVADDDRTARFVCVMALLLPYGAPHVGMGTVEGLITTREIGKQGFGYDPIFFYPPAGKTFAELTAEEKNAVSHRRRAADAVLAALAPRA